MTIDEAIAEIERLSDENANLDAACKMEHRENERLPAELQRIADHLEIWARDHADDATTETWAALYCVRSILAKSESPTPEKES
jgi:predicted RNase H-like nuclease (RuvC/YqgF family)